MAAHLDARRIRYVAGNYRQLQGLRNVALGAACAAGGLTYILVPTAPAAMTVALWVGLGLSWLAGRYYERTFGQVRASDSHWVSGLYAARIALRAAAVVLVIIAVIAGVPLYVILGLLGLAFAVGYPFYLQHQGGLALRPYWGVACVIIAAWSILLLLPLPALTSLHRAKSSDTLFAVWVLLLGLAATVGGLLDHRLLLRTLPRPEAS